MKRCLALCLLLACCLPLDGQLPQFGSLKLSQVLRVLKDAGQMTFRGRAIAPESQTILQNLSHDFSGIFEKEYGRFVDRALIVRNPGVVDNKEFQYEPFFGDPSEPRGRWSFPTLLRKALHGFDPAKIDGAMQKVIQDSSPRLGTAWKLADPDKHLDNIPLRLLAIANRLDLGRLVTEPGANPGAATCPKGEICGAELHFVYAGMIPPQWRVPTQNHDPYLTVILEFVLPPLSKEDFQSLAWKWIQLYEKPSDLDGPDDLGEVLDEVMNTWSGGKGTARIRMNAREDDWTLYQLALTSQGLIRTPLNQEPNVTGCVAAGSPVGQYTATFKGDILGSNYDFYKLPAMGELPQPADCPAAAAALQRCSAILSDIPKPVLSLPSNLVSPPAHTDATRFALSLNSCTGCHGWETRGVVKAPHFDRTGPFDQIHYREPKQTSSMSGFLTGAADGNPHLYSFWHVQPLVAPNCGPAAEAKDYNDLLRRTVFHLVVVSLLSVNTPLVLANDVLDLTWSTALNAHGITAWQPH